VNPANCLQSRDFSKSLGAAGKLAEPRFWGTCLIAIGYYQGHHRRAIYHLVDSIADAKAHTILLNLMDCG
jgi:hypothetical protein